MNTATSISPRLRWAGLLLGFSLAGFFDGILLHQVLQWHHLLSQVRLAALQDLRAQMLADGLFHALMYFIAVWALVLLWKARGEFCHPGADRMFGVRVLIGFGTWHIVDAVLSHWITGIHRIRVDSPNPLAWDLLWFALFGLGPLVLGWRATRHPGGGGGGGGRAATALALAAVVGGAVAALPPQGSDAVVVMFRPGFEGGPAFNALARADARILWSDSSGGLWAVSLPEAASIVPLYREGALVVSRSSLAMGCLAWSRTAS